MSPSKNNPDLIDLPGHEQRPGSILLIDDDPDFLLIHEYMLGSAGYQVLKAETGSEGLQLLQKNPVDIILLDINLPDANGLELCRHIKNDESMSSCLVFLVSAVQASFDERIRGLKAGAEGYLLKPLHKEELLLRMESALRVKRTQDMLRFERSQLLSIFDSIDESIYVIDPETYEILFANETMKELFGRELVGKTCYQVLQRKESPCEFCSNDILFENKGAPYQWEHKNPILEKDFLVTDKIIKWPDGRDVRFELAIDITRRKQAEEALQKSEERFKLAMEATKDGLWDWDVTSNDAYFSPAYTQMLGYDPASVSPGFQFWLDHVHQDDREKALAHITDCIENRTQYFEVEFRMKNVNNDWLWILGRGNAVSRDSEGRATRMIGTHSDITQRKQDEQRLLDLTRKANELAEQAEAANRAKSEFLANMSHEIRTPLSGILGMTDHLLDSGLNNEQKKDAMIIKSSGETLLGLINDILDFSKIEAGKLEISRNEFNLHRVVEDICRDMALRAGNKNLKFHCNLSHDLPSRVCGDDLRLTQVLSNLTGNALKFTDQGKINLNVFLNSQTEQEYLVYFEVLDTGEGIESDKIDHLFDKFFQADSSSSRRQGGTGLGLAISRQLVSLMGGEIGVESTPGKGSRFWFTVVLYRDTPQCDHDERDEDESVLQKERAVRRGRILLAEDNQVNRMVLGKMLDSIGHETVYARDGIEAVEIYKNEGVDLVLMDIQMPGMDGLEATRRIRSMEQAEGMEHGAEDKGQRSGDRGQRLASDLSELSEGASGRSESLNSSIPQFPNSEVPESQNRIPILALTAHAMKDDKEKSLDAGMDDYITKPVKKRILQQKIQQWLSLDASRHEKGDSEDLHEFKSEISGNAGQELENSMPHFDRATLMERLDGDKELAVEILTSFLKSVPEQISLVREEAEAGINSRGQKTAHAIKGTSANTGCMLLSETAARMEQLFKEKDVQQLPEQAMVLQKRFDQTRQEIESFLREQE